MGVDQESWGTIFFHITVSCPFTQVMFGYVVVQDSLLHHGSKVEHSVLRDPAGSFLVNK